MGDIRLLLVDDSAEIRSALREVAEANHCRVVGEAENGREALRIVSDVAANVLLLDISMPVMGGFETARQLQHLAPDISIIFVTQHADPIYVREAFRLGGRGYVLKSAIADELGNAIECLRNNQTYRSPLLSQVRR